MNTFRIVFLVFLTAFSKALPSSAQQARASLDTNAILIGQQINLHLELTHPKGKRYTWPVLPDSIHKLEVISRSLPDTLADEKNLTIRQSLLITCFDSGYYAIPPFRFTDQSNPDSLTNFSETPPLLLAVHTVEVDTTASIKDIKPIIEIPLTWKDIVPYAAAVLALAVLTFVILLLYRRLKKKSPIAEKKQPALPAHEIALNELTVLESKKLWQQGQLKAYYTELTDILRNYLDHRWQVNAMEMTSEEILNYPVVYKLDDESKGKLRYILSIADLVKFAKMVTVPHENEQCLIKAREFVNATAQRTLVSQAEPEKKEVTV